MKIGTPTLLTPRNILPPDVEKLVVMDGNSKVCDVTPGHLTLSDMGEKLYSVGLLSDSHVQVNTGNGSDIDFPRALRYFSENADLVCLCGDGVHEGTEDNFALYRSFVEENLPNVSFYPVTGNHETYTGTDPYLHDEDTVRTLFRTYARVPLYYTVSSNPTSELDSDGVIVDGGNFYNAAVGDDVYIIMGLAKDYVYFGRGAGSLQWLYETLEANRNKRCFVFEHIRPDDASGNGENLHWTDLWYEDLLQAKAFTSLIKHYKNVIFFHGHSHFTLELQTRTNLANIDEIYGRYSIHIPSVTYPVGLPADENNIPTTLLAKSEGYLMDVYAKHIVLRGLDFAEDRFISIAQYCLDTTSTLVKPGTYIDATGLIST